MLVSYKTPNKFKLLCVAVVGLNTLSMPTFAELAEITVDSGGIKIKQGETKFKIGGRIVLDYDYFNGVHNNGETGSGTVLRRARITINGALNQNWDSKLTLNFDDENKKTSLKYAYVKYKGWKDVELTMGKSKAVFGMEALASSKYLPTIERSMVSDVFAPSYQYGLALFAQRGQLTVAGGVYTEKKTEDNWETYAWTGRLTYAPLKTKDAVIHLGLAGSYRDLEGNDYQIKKPAEVYQANEIVTTALTIADSVTLLGLEAGVGLGPFTFQSEYMKADVEAEPVSGHPDAAYDGYYAVVGYFLTGESFSYGKGYFRKPKFHHGHGAWQLAALFSHLDADDNNEGVEVENITVGINYYPIQEVRLSANYIMTDVKGSDADPNEDHGKALTFRFQYLF